MLDDQYNRPQQPAAQVGREDGIGVSCIDCGQQEVAHCRAPYWPASAHRRNVESGTSSCKLIHDHGYRAAIDGLTLERLTEAIKSRRDKHGDYAYSAEGEAQQLFAELRKGQQS